ncbi:MAG: tRNA uracil 4-sulfurtransferase ThiI [Bacillales bacterium]
MNYNSIMVRFGELSTKGKNKKDFINSLARSIRQNLIDFKDLYEMNVRHDHIYLNLKEMNLPLIDNLKNIPGMYSFSLCLKLEDVYDVDELKEICLKEIKNEEGKSFKIKSKRVDKSFPYTSDDIIKEVASHILKNTDLKVDVHKPDILLSIEVHQDGIYVFTNTIKGIGGYPKGSIGRGLMMLSGGIDSPVASYLLMKRGVELSFIHFSAPPYTNRGVILKLQDILSELNIYQNKINLYVINFTKLQLKIYEASDEGYPITIMRRMMYRIASKVANKLHVPIIASGESIGQVASQTLESLSVINSVTNYPIIRPLATMDKLEIIDISKKINTYDISIRPFEDCCTIFNPVRPKTSPKEDICLKIEEKINYEELINECLDTMEKIIIKKE